jgi:hypothetical protein
MMVACLRSMMAVGLRSLMACSGLEFRIAASSRTGSRMVAVCLRSMTTCSRLRSRKEAACLRSTAACSVPRLRTTACFRAGV